MSLCYEFGQSHSFASRLLGEWPNCYTFTKSVAEDLIRTEAKNLPAVIVRPAIGTTRLVETFSQKSLSSDLNYRRTDAGMD
jgi:hypothetical protein